MGFLSRFKADAFPGQDAARDLWRQTFGATTKERPARPVRGKQSVAGGSWGNSASSEASTKRLIQALRSMAPGGWSDDRWEQGSGRHYVGIQYVAIHRQNEMLSQAEFQVFKRDPSVPAGKRPVTPNDPPQGDRVCKPYDLVNLLEKPNREDSFGDLLAMWNLQMDMTGMALTWMVPNELGNPMELYPIPTAIAIPQPAINPDFPDGYWRIQPVYPYGPFSSYPTPTTAVGAPIPAQWMMRFKYPHPLLRYDGWSPYTAARLNLDVIEQIDRSRFYKMGKSINPSAVLSMKDMEEAQPFSKDVIDRILAEFEAQQQGPVNHGRLFVCPPGGSLDEFGRAPVDMDYGAGWDQEAGFILGGVYGITKPAAGMVEDSSYSTLYATLQQLYWVTLDPKMNRIGQKLTRFLAPFFGDDLIVEVRGRRINDHEINFGKADRLGAMKAGTKNEVRVLLGMEPTTEPWGKEIAGDPSQAEKEMVEKDQEIAAAGNMNPEGGILPGEENPAERERPRAGMDMRGSLGPRQGTVKGLGRLKALRGRNGGLVAPALPGDVPELLSTLRKFVRVAAKNGKH